ncbi:uncharacterized protein LOC62_07G009751 [Vanrija pseudolonga]|uniref:F-box domain-containing protein n=1 Tax=Vanrija pseudolonga TaxID=143232 RepID=A0AAF0YJ78_9TREE|nr:hypothetical protein LOC62_07G009751 [Vanrija pseudolonga]
MPDPAAVLDAYIFGDILSHLSLAELVRSRGVSTRWRKAAEQKHIYKLPYLSYEGVDAGTRRKHYIGDKVLREQGNAGIDWKQLCDEYLASSRAWAAGKPVTSLLEDNSLTYHSALTPGPNGGVYVLDVSGSRRVNQAQMEMPYVLVEPGPSGAGVRVAERADTPRTTVTFSPSIGVYQARVASCEAPDNYVLYPWYVELWVSAGVWEDFGARERVYDATEWPALAGMQTNPPPQATYAPEGIYAGFRRLAIFPAAPEQGPYGMRVASPYSIHVSVPDSGVGELEIAAAHYTFLSRHGDHFVLGLQVTLLASTCDPTREGAVETMAGEPHKFATSGCRLVLDNNYVFQVWVPDDLGRNTDAAVHVYSRARGASTPSGFMTALNVDLEAALQAGVSPIFWVSVTGQQFDDLVEPALVEEMERNGGILDLRVDPVRADNKKRYNLYTVLLNDRERGRPGFSGLQVCGTALCLFRSTGSAFIIQDYADVFAFAETLPPARRAAFIAERTVILATPRPIDKGSSRGYHWAVCGTRLIDRTLLFDMERLPRLPDWLVPWKPRSGTALARASPLGTLRCRALVNEVPEEVLLALGVRLERFVLTPSGLYFLPFVTEHGPFDVARINSPNEVRRYEAIQRGEWIFSLRRVWFPADGEGAR